MQQSRGSRRQRVLRLPVKFCQPGRGSRLKPAEAGDRRRQERRDAGSREASRDHQLVCSSRSLCMKEIRNEMKFGSPKEDYYVRISCPSPLRDTCRTEGA
jgi:hypothetical protein